jgi:hypothetical protein
MHKTVLAAAAAVAAIWPVASLAQADTSVTPTKYCTDHHGTVQVRTPTYNTNGGTPFPLSGPRQFCQWVAADGSQIDVLLTTLVTPKPTLAALAYYARVKFNGVCEGSPGSCYCSQIGGTDLFGGINAAGGGWVLQGNSNDVLDACIFPDLSSIDSYGLFYHQHDIIRGKDLGYVLRYKNPYQK